MNDGIKVIILKSSSLENISRGFSNNKWAVPNKKSGSRKSVLTKFRKRHHECTLNNQPMYVLFQDGENECIRNGGTITSEPMNNNIRVLPMESNEIWEDRETEEGTFPWYGAFDVVFDSDPTLTSIPITTFTELTGYTKKDIALSSRSPFTKCLTIDKHTWQQIKQMLVPKNSEIITRDAISWTQEPSTGTLKICEQIKNSINNYVGKVEIYDNSVYAAAKLFEMITNRQSGNRGIAIGDLQSGKTGLMQVLSHAAPMLISHTLNIPISKVRVGILLVTNQALKVLKAQTRERFERSGYKERFSRINETWLESTLGVGQSFLLDEMMSGGAIERLEKKVEIFKKSGITHTIILLDEVHVAIGSEHQFAKFLENNGWLVQQSGSNVYQPPLYIAGVTATPLKRFILPDVQGCTDLYYSYSKPGKGYYGVKDMLDQHRIQSIEKLNDYGTLQQKIIDSNIEHPGYIVVRIETKNPTALKNFSRLSAEMGWNTPVEFNAAKDNISQLNPRLSTPPEKTTVLFIKNASRAGFTYETVEHISAEFNFRYNDPEANLQSNVGRSCGYTKDRKNARYPIFVNITPVKKYLHAMELCITNEPIPELRRGLSSRASKPTLHLVDSIKILDHHLMFGTQEEFDKHADKFEDHLQLTEDHKKITTTEKNEVLNISGMLLGDISPKNLASRFNCNYAPKEEFVDSYNRLIQRYPQLKQDGIMCWVDRRQLKMVSSNNSFNKDGSGLNKL